MSANPQTFGKFVRQQRRQLDLTQAELARRVGCATITIRKIEADSLRPSVQIAERLAMSLGIPIEDRADFVRLARAANASTPSPPSMPATPVDPEEIGQEDLRGRAIRGYQLGEKIGEGGFGVVYRASQPVVNRDVAIKIILPEYANRPDFIRRFEAEAQLIARLEHPYIVPLYDYWREPNVAYLVMRLLRGGSLKQKLKDGPLDPESVIHILSQIGQALESAHRMGIVHRDIKPANILLDEAGNGYLADFGIAKNLGNPNADDQTATGSIIGSHAYISPEQILSEPVRPQSDIYCLGIMAYEMLTGVKPFQGPTPVNFVMQHLNEPLPIVAQQGVELPLAVDKVLMRATAKKSEERFEGVMTFVGELEQALLGSTISLTSAKGEGDQQQINLQEAENPYRGLRAFTEADAENFYGRETLVQEMLGKLGEGSDLNHFLAMVGPSGSGKSSVVKAGLVPAVRRGGLPNSENWFVVDMTPSSHPFEELEAALLRVAVNPPDSLLGQLKDGNRGILRAVRRVLPNDGQTELLLLVDQFEELFTLVDDEAEREAFIEGLITAVLDPKSRLRIVLTLRADFTDRPLQYADLGELMRQRTLFVLPLSPDELEEAIRRPVSRLGMTLEPGLLATIVQEVAGEPGMLPLLQYGLTELFERRMGSRLTLAAYQEMGGVTGALAKRADEILAQLDEAGQEIARQLFLRLVTLGEGVEDTRRRVLQTELKSLQATNQPSDQGTNEQLPMVNLFGKYRLLTFDHDPATRTPTVEVAHEALLREWPRLRSWLRESREEVRQQRQLAEAARLWTANEQDESYLLRGSRLTAFAAWQEKANVALTEGEQGFLRASHLARDVREAEEASRQQRELQTAQKLAETERGRAEESRQNLQRVRALASGLALLFVVALAIAWFANSQRIQAQDSFANSERLRLASLAQGALDRGESGAAPMLLALESLNQGYSVEAEKALTGALLNSFPEKEFFGHIDSVASVDVTADGRYMLSSGLDNSIRLWDVQTGEEIRQFVGHVGGVNRAIFSPDEQTILSSSLDGTSRVWDVQSGEEISQLPINENDAWSAAFSENGKLAVTSHDNVLRVWDAQEWEEIYTLEQHNSLIFWSEISPDSRFIVSGDNDGVIILWDLQNGNLIREFQAHDGFIGEVAFSPDSRYILTVGEDGHASIWDIETGIELRRFIGHTDAVNGGVFSPDGRTIATGSVDGTIRIWDVESSRERRQIAGHGESSWIAFSPDGQGLYTFGTDTIIRLWNVELDTEPIIYSPEVIGHQVFQNALYVAEEGEFAFIGDTTGKIAIWRAATGQLEKEFRPNSSAVTSFDYVPSANIALISSVTDLWVWDIQSEELPLSLKGHEGVIWEAKFSHDGLFAASASSDNTARIWELSRGEEVQRFNHPQVIRTIAFSPDGNLLATGSVDGIIRLWSIQEGWLAQSLNGHSEAVSNLAFSPNGTHLLSGSNDESAILWELENGSIVHQLRGHSNLLTKVAFSPDGAFALTGSLDKTVLLWDLNTGEQLRQLTGHNSQIQFVDFTNDGKQIITGDSRSYYIWRVELDEVMSFACSQLERGFTDEEKQKYNLSLTTSACQNESSTVALAEPTWTPIFNTPTPTDSVHTTVNLEFVGLDVANQEMGAPVQHLYIQVNDEQVGRLDSIQPEYYSLPLFTSSQFVTDTYEAPFDLGPFPIGTPLDFTLEDWIAASGKGTYEQNGAQAVIDLQFSNLVPNGVYTLWCAKLGLPTFDVLEERPCGAADGSENVFITDEQGNGAIQLTMFAFPPSTEEIFHEIAVAYHSDGQTYGEVVGEYGKNVHVHLIYDFFAPEQ